MTWPVHVIAMAIVVALAYGRTLDVPFYLDDYSSILENRLVWDWQGFAALRDYAPMRVLVYAGFALNYAWSDFDPAGYHLTNLVIHLLGGVAVYGLARGLFRAASTHAATRRTGSDAAVAGGMAPAGRMGLALFVALLFLLHPLQTGAVTYIVQRLASQVALLYVAALAAYLKGRLSEGRGARVIWFAACFALGLAALFSKENAATLPGAILLLELLVLRPSRRDLPRLAGLMLASVALVWTLAALSFGGNPFSLSSMGGIASQSGEISRGTYLATQMPVLWTYLRLFLWPAGLHLEWAVETLTFSDPRAWGSLAGHLAVIAAALAVRGRFPVFGFGLLFYYLAHIVESGVIPIPELAFEHRSYLPNLGLCLASGDLLRVISRTPLGKAGTVAFATLALLLLGGTTWLRNEQWRHPIPFWQENVRRAPTSPRAWGQLGRSLVLANRSEEGMRALRESLRLRSARSAEDDNWAYDLANLAEALRQVGRAAEGLPMIERALERPASPARRAALLIARGNLLVAESRWPEAEASYREALRHQPMNLTAIANLASAVAQMGRLETADSLYGEVLRVHPHDAASRENRLQVHIARLVERGDRQRSAHRDAEADSAFHAALERLDELRRMNPANPAIETGARRIRDRLNER